MNMDHDSTIPSRLMPDDYAASTKQTSPEGHPIVKILLVGAAVVSFLIMLKLLKH
jgi:hypothetical protein